MKKMNTLLATVEQSAARCTRMLKDYAGFFKKNQGDFLGAKKTYTAREVMQMILLSADIDV